MLPWGLLFQLKAVGPATGVNEVLKGEYVFARDVIAAAAGITVPKPRGKPSVEINTSAVWVRS